MVKETEISATASRESVAYWASIPYSAIAKLPDNQLQFLLTSTRIANDILLLQRLVIAVENSRRHSDHDEIQAGVIAWFTGLALLSGKLWEGYLALSRYARLWRPDSAIKLSLSGDEARISINKYFANGSPLEKIRNASAFHYDGKDVLASEVSEFRKLMAGDSSMKWILGSEIANTYYLFSAASNGFAILDAAYPSLPRPTQMLSLYDDVIGAADAMGKFLMHAITSILSQPGIEADLKILLEPISMRGRPNVNELTFFMLARTD